MVVERGPLDCAPRMPGPPGPFPTLDGDAPDEPPTVYGLVVIGGDDHHPRCTVVAFATVDDAQKHAADEGILDYYVTPLEILPGSDGISVL